jgi:beta-RFAP synthase
VAIPDVPRGLSGKAEAAAFRRLPPPSAQKVGRIARLILMGALPALIERDLKGFGAAVAEIQRHVGDCFKDVQGGRFAHPASARLIRELERRGAPGAGQTSWGPAVFALAADAEQAEHLAGVARDVLDSGGDVFVTSFDNGGARRGPVPSVRLGP